jgi:phospholipase/lecithinase/hemolysin
MALEQQLPCLSLTKLDLDDVLNKIVTNPDQYHLTNVTDACIRPNVAPYSCLEPEHYLFWDGTHPTTAGHGIFAMFAKKALDTSSL